MLQDGVEKGVGDLLRFIITQASRREQNGEINGRKRYDPKLKNLTNSLPTVPGHLQQLPDFFIIITTVSRHARAFQTWIIS